MVGTTNAGGIGLRLNFADGPRRSRILADDVLGEIADASENDDSDGILEVDGLKELTMAEQFDNKDDDGGGGGQFNGESR